MANDLIPANDVFSQIQHASRLPLLRQLGLLIGLSASVALGVAVVFWAQTPSYRVLYGNLAERDQAQILTELQKTNIPYKTEPGTGALMVPEKNVHDARLKLAAAGLPRGANTGFELIEEGNHFGASQLMEAARYQRAQEGELARTIMSVNNVQNARVHLAIPKPTAFARNRQQPSASVLVSLYAGRNLDDGQVAAIVHLVASSVPNLDSTRVTIIDQKGRLLTASGKGTEMELTAGQFEHTRKFEETFVRRIEDILTPIIGPGGVKAQVALDMDYTTLEQTQESFKPDAALRSEQVAEDRSAPGAGVAGIPGALSNQPPGAASVPEGARAQGSTPPAAPAAKPVQTETAAAPAGNSSRRATRNYELDKTISYTRAAPGKLKRLSVAVLVDNKQVLNADGEVERKPLAAEELARLTALVKDAVGFSVERGDSVQILNTPFTTPPEAEEPPEQTLLEKPWLWDVGKQALGGLVVLLIVFGVLKPLLKQIASRPLPDPGASLAGASMLSHGAAPGMLAGPGNYEASLNAARSIAAQDPKRAAQVVKTWVSSDG